MKRIIAVIVCLTLCLLAMSSCGSINSRHKPYGVMTAVEQIDDGSGKYTKKIELSDETIKDILFLPQEQVPAQVFLLLFVRLSKYKLL